MRYETTEYLGLALGDDTRAALLERFPPRHEHSNHLIEVERRRFGVADPIRLAFILEARLVLFRTTKIHERIPLPPVASLQHHG